MLLLLLLLKRKWIVTWGASCLPYESTSLLTIPIIRGISDCMPRGIVETYLSWPKLPNVSIPVSSLLANRLAKCACSSSARNLVCGSLCCVGGAEIDCGGGDWCPLAYVPARLNTGPEFWGGGDPVCPNDGREEVDIDRAGAGANGLLDLCVAMNHE